MKLCQYCKKPLELKLYKGKCESKAMFERRKYCDQICMGKASRK